MATVMYDKNGKETDVEKNAFAKLKTCETGTVCYGLALSGRLVNPASRQDNFREKFIVITSDSFTHYLNFLKRKDTALLTIANRSK